MSDIWAESNEANSYWDGFVEPLTIKIAAPPLNSRWQIAPARQPNVMWWKISRYSGGSIPAGLAVSVCLAASVIKVRLGVSSSGPIISTGWWLYFYAGFCDQASGKLHTFDEVLWAPFSITDSGTNNASVLWLTHGWEHGTRILTLTADVVWLLWHLGASVLSCKILGALCFYPQAYYAGRMLYVTAIGVVLCPLDRSIDAQLIWLTYECSDPFEPCMLDHPGWVSSRRLKFIVNHTSIMVL